MAAKEIEQTLPFTVAGTIVGGKYQVEHVLGKGGMGVVVRARHLVLDEPVAMKFVLPKNAKLPESTARFVREAKAGLRLKNEHITRVLDIGVLESGELFMVMELLEGEDLAALLARSGSLPMAAAIDLTLQACRGLADGHAQGIIHRDIKPANLFLTRDVYDLPLVKLLDFGISKVMGEVDVLTQTSTMLGSTLYTSPEQLRSSRDVDARTDVYSLGVTVFEMLAGRSPFTERSIARLVAQILKGAPTKLEALRPDLPVELTRSVHSAIAVDPNDRPSSAFALAQQLVPFASDYGRAFASRIAEDRTYSPSAPSERRGSLPIEHLPKVAMDDRPHAATVAFDAGLATFVGPRTKA